MQAVKLRIFLGTDTLTMFVAAPSEAEPISCYLLEWLSRSVTYDIFSLFIRVHTTLQENGLVQ